MDKEFQKIDELFAIIQDYDGSVFKKYIKHRLDESIDTEKEIHAIGRQLKYTDSYQSAFMLELNNYYHGINKQIQEAGLNIENGNPITLFTKAEVASKLRVSNRFIEKLVASGTMKCKKIGHQKNSPVRWTQEMIDDFLSSCPGYYSDFQKSKQGDFHD